MVILIMAIPGKRKISFLILNIGALLFPVILHYHYHIVLQSLFLNLLYKSAD